MTLKEKLERAFPVLDSIIDHHDGDSAVRKAALDRLIAHCEAGKAKIDEALEAQAGALVD